MTKYADVDLTHPWARDYRIALVHQSPYDSYLTALVVPEPGRELSELDGAEWPTQDEALVVASVVDFMRSEFTPSFRRHLLNEPLDVEGWARNLVLAKRRPQAEFSTRPYGWYYRWRSWETPWSAAGRSPDVAGLIATLDAAFDQIPGWFDWKAAHPETFPKSS